MRGKTGTFFKTTEFYLLLVIAGLVAILTVATEDFFTLENLFDVLVSYSFLGIMAVGLLVVLISGGIDISFTATATVAQYVMAIFIIRHGGGWWLAFLIPIAIGIKCSARL
jgi:simple sugar transport system permease protein